MRTRISSIVTALVLGDRTERGANLIEYALLMALIAMVCVAAVTTLGGHTGSNFSSLSTKI